MPQIINTNIASINAQRNLDKSQSANQQALQRLSSGLRINSAKDDAAGLAISTRFTSQIKGLNVAVRNAGDGIALAQTAEGALGSINENLQRVRELAVQSANATNSDVDREALQAEVDQLVAEISRTADETDFNGRKLLDGSFSATFQIGANAGQTVDVTIAELTADKLGSARTAGISAIGSDQALENGDLVINGVAIAASKAGDDTASTSNAAASAIAKVAAINQFSDQTGVTASVDKNVVSGSEMEAIAGTTTLTLNGVDIDLSTTSSTVQTRAAVAEAVNAVADQTGVRAINTNTDSGGVQLVAEDGRNVEISFADFGGSLTSGNVATATGLAFDGAGTYEGGYTLVADGDVGKIEIAGGNGTGNGDLDNSGLVAGTYERGTATTVSREENSQLTATTVGGGSLSNALADYTDNATLISGGSLANTLATTQVAASAVSEVQNIAVTVDGTDTMLTIPSASAVYEVASALNGVAGVTAFERIEFTINDFSTATGGGSLRIAGQSIALTDDALADYDTVTERNQYLTEAINNTTFGAGITVTAELSFDKSAISVTVDNGTGDVLRIGVSTGAALTASAGGALAVPANVTAVTSGSAMIGQVAFTTSGAANEVAVAFTESTAGAAASGELYAGKTFVGSDTGNAVLSTTGTNEINVSIEGVAVGSSTVQSGATVSDIVSTLNGIDSDINAFEEISLTFDATNVDVGDTLFIGTGTDVTAGGASGVGVAVSDGDADGTVELNELADSINEADFSAQNMDVSASINADGELVLNIRNYSGSQVGIAVDGEGRSLQQKTTGDLVGSVQQQLSGQLRYSSETGRAVSVSIADADVGGELYTGNSSSTEFAGVNGLDDGDILINGVSIGSAKIEADKASAVEASDGTKILSSSKEKSGIAIAAAINDVADETGVRATVNATEVVGGDGTNADTSAFEIGDSAEIYINGYSAGTVTLQDDGSGNIDTDRAKADALSIINSVSGRTGTTATDNGVSLTLNAEDGRNISIAINDESGSDSSIGALFGLDSAVAGIGESTFGEARAATNTGVSAESLTYETTYSTIRLDSAGEFTISSGSAGADELDALGLSEGSFGGAVDGTFLTDIDISTFEGAQAAITSIDNAISQVASQRADLGAIQNRLESTVSNLQVTSENLNAANSRIQDADFAAETAELSRTQVLQQAGISVLAQANAAGQQVLSLLG
jgi:flagellin